MTPRSFRQRFPGPWIVERTPGGFHIRSGSTNLCCIYVYTREWESVATTGQFKLTWAEGLALAEVVASLGEKSRRKAMSEIDRQRIAAVRTLEALGYRFSDGRWNSPLHAARHIPAETDALHTKLVAIADKIAENLGIWIEHNLEAIGEAMEAYEAVRWPDGKVDGGKG